MKYYDAVEHEPATPDYVLAVFRDWYGRDPGADPDVDLSFETTVEEWREHDDLIDWQEFGRNLNAFWEIDCSDAEWKAVLEPARTKPLAAVCELIARHATRPRIRPSRWLGRTCAPAGAFLAVRSLLTEAGVDPREIAPSTPLAPYARRHWGTLLDVLTRLAPGALPPVRIRTPVHDAAVLGIVIGAVGLLAGNCAGLPVVTIAGGVLYVSSFAATWIAARYLLPASVEFGNLMTFRDLAKLIAIAGTDELANS